VPDANDPQSSGTNLGYTVTTPREFPVNNVSWVQPPTGAIVTLNWFAPDTVVPSVSVNGGPWHETPWPFDGNLFSWRSIAVPISPDEVHAGNNVVAMRWTGQHTPVVSNINLILIAGAPVP
jgi:hypothetical protein